MNQSDVAVPGGLDVPGQDDRKTAAVAGYVERAALERAPDGTMRVSDFGLIRRILRGSGTRQSGFGADLMGRFKDLTHTPVLYQEGEPHLTQRAAVGRFFAPKVVSTRYRMLMERFTDGLVARFRAASEARLDELSFELAVAVAAEIVGLTDSSRSGMDRRLNKFFNLRIESKSWLGTVRNFLRAQSRLLSFHLFDVRPAIAARRRAPGEDVISHLIAQGYTNREILTECLIYGAAGMATTREFITVAAWHLFTQPDLMQQFLATDETGRTAILEEILRLEPVVGTLYRRATEAITLTAGGTDTMVAAGSRIALDVRAANADPAIAGECPYRLAAEPGMKKNMASGMSFGDGPHRCPGAAVALQETEIFLDRLLRVPGIRMDKPPSVTWNPLIESYEIREMIIRADRA
jgi:cytochrome P450